MEELERIVRMKEAEVGDMRMDLQKLADVLQTNTTKAIYETFVDTHYN